MSGAPPRILLATSENLSRYLLLYDSRTDAAAPSRFGSGSLPLLSHERHAFPATEPAYETLLAAAAKHSSAPRELRPPGEDLPRISGAEKISELHRGDVAASCARAAACCAFRWRRKPARRAGFRRHRKAQQAAARAQDAATSPRCSSDIFSAPDIRGKSSPGGRSSRGALECFAAAARSVSYAGSVAGKAWRSCDRRGREPAPKRDGAAASVRES